MRTMSRWGIVVVAASGLIWVSSGLAFAGASDAWITSKTKLALLTTKDIGSTGINVDTSEGVVTLHGQVSSATEKAIAENETKKIDGVKSIHNLIQVVPRLHEKTVKASDSQVETRVATALKNDRSLADSTIAVQSVHDGVVLLGGNALSVGDHLRAVQIARAVPGVRYVATEVKSPDTLADEELRRDTGAPATDATRGIAGATKDMWITSDTKTRLLADGRTPALDVNVDTWNGVVTLFGSVPSKDAKAAAEADARKVSGVTRVRNELQVVPSAKKEHVAALDGDLKTAVQQSLAGREELKGVDVDVKNGVARLTGTVQTEQSRMDAAMAARSTAGVRSVEDDLRISAPARAS